MSGAQAKELLVEVGVEEMPARVVAPLGVYFARQMQERLTADGFSGAGDKTAVEWFATPRRLAFRLANLLQRLPDRVVERKGPSVAAAYDDGGNPTAAATGFAKSCGVALADVEQRDGRLYCRSKVAGLSLRERVEHNVKQVLAAAPLSERMRWQSQKPAAAACEFIRPVRWLLALYGSDVLEMEVLGVRAGGVSRGHRCGDGRPVEVAGAAAGVYERALEQNGVIVSFERREAMIAAMLGDAFPAPDDDKGAHARAAFLHELENFCGAELDEHGGGAIEALIRENAAMVEWPHAVIGSFDEAFAGRLPRSLIIQALVKNQKFFLGIDRNAGLANRFLVITNTKSCAESCAESCGRIRRGFERVARPRLNDAAFFLEQDTRAGLERRLQELGQVVFHKDLGSLADKVARITQLAAVIAASLRQADANFAVDDRVLGDAARLCKADLLSDTVREYPALEGEIGAYCARREGDDAVAAVIAEHCMPRTATAPLPATAEGCVLALADRLDTLAGIFGVGTRVSGSKDPYALRRASIGVIRLILALGRRVEEAGAAGLDFDMFELIDIAAAGYERQLKRPLENTAAVKQYLLERLKNYYPVHKPPPRLPSDQVEAAMAVSPERLLDLDARLAAINRYSQMPQMEVLIAANKRISNILKKNAAEAGDQTIDEGVMKDDAERLLYRSLRACADSVTELADRRRYREALENLVGLHQPIGRFFDEVLVMERDEAVRRNRINLLRAVRALFMRIGDFSKLTPHSGKARAEDAPR